MEETLVDVQNYIGNRRKATFKRLRCYIVNYTAMVEFPQKFWYSGCSVQRANGTYCAKVNCDHKGRGLKRPMYRFQLQVTDHSPSHPVTVTIFDKAQKLIGMPPEKFCQQSHDLQLELVRDVTSKSEGCKIDVHVKEDPYSGHFVAIVQKLIRLNLPSEDDLIAEIMGTPTSPQRFARSPGEFYTPQQQFQAFGRTEVGESSSQRKTSRRSNSSRSARLSSVKMKLNDVMQIIDLTLDD